jgi:PAS domain S-box-containing protein
MGFINFTIVLIAGVILGVMVSHFLQKLPIFLTKRRTINQAKMMTINQSSSDGFVIVDTFGGIVHANHALLSIFDYQLEQLLTRNISLLIPSTQTQCLNQKIKHYLNTGSCSFFDSQRQLIAVTREGKVLDISLSINFVKVASTPLFTAFIRDISDKVKLNRQVEYQRNKFETLFKSCPDHIIYVNEQLKIQDANKNFLTLYGSQLSDLCGTDVRNLFSTDTTKLDNIKELLLETGVEWGKSDIIARLNSYKSRQVTVLISQQKVDSNDDFAFIYILRDISKELELIGHIAEKNRYQELSEAMVKMGYWRFDAKTQQLWCSNQIFQILKIDNLNDNIVSLKLLYQMVPLGERLKAKKAFEQSFAHLIPLSISVTIHINEHEQKKLVIKGICEIVLGQVIAIYGVVQDVSEQLAQEEYLTLTKERLEQSQTFSNIGNWHWDIQNDIMCWSELAAPMFGGKTQEVENDFNQFINLIHPDDTELVTCAIRRCTDKSKGYSIEFRVIWHDTSVHWIHQQGNVIRDSKGIAIRMIGVVQDITERKNKESELTLFKQIIESSSQAIVVCNNHGELIYANPAHQHQFLHKPQIDQYHFSDFLVPGFESSGLHLQIEQSLKETDHWSGEIQSKKLDNNTFPAHISLNQFHDKINKRQYRFSICYDVSAQIEQKQHLQQAKLDAESANRAKSEFLSSMSHELRTPLNAVLGFSQLLLRQKEVEFNERVVSNIEAIYKAGDHLLTLINGVLELAKIESGNKPPEYQRVDIKAVIDEAIDLIACQAEQKGLNLVTPQSSKIPVLYSHRQVPIVEGDFTIVKQAILNYLSNAVKYNKDDGIIFINVDINEAQKTTRISVSDNGIGIATELISELFIPFNRLGLETSSIEGTGIGLAITKKNIENMYGIVGVKSKLGAGSCFWIELPYVELYEQPINNSCSDSIEPPLNTANEQVTVLYIEDNQSNTQLMQGYFNETNNARLICANTAELGLIYAAQYHPKIILIDLNLPGMDGYAALQQLKAQLKFDDCIMIAVTADVMNKTKEKAKAAGFDEFLTKPIDYDTLQDTLQKYL